eukprot:6189009-Pleurochrysis_carterae.AAC.1
MSFALNLARPPPLQRPLSHTFACFLPHACLSPTCATRSRPSQRYSSLDPSLSSSSLELFIHGRLPRACVMLLISVADSQHTLESSA